MEDTAQHFAHKIQWKTPPNILCIRYSGRHRPTSCALDTMEDTVKHLALKISFDSLMCTSLFAGRVTKGVITTEI